MQVPNSQTECTFIFAKCYAETLPIYCLVFLSYLYPQKSNHARPQSSNHGIVFSNFWRFALFTVNLRILPLFPRTLSTLQVMRIYLASEYCGRTFSGCANYFFNLDLFYSWIDSLIWLYLC